MSRAAIGWGVVLVVVGLTLWASSPYSGLLFTAVELVPGGDKTGHVLIMGALAAACVWAFAGREWRGHRVGAGLVLALVAGAVTVDEVVQAFVPTRTFDWADLGASLVGVALIGGGMAFVRKRRQSGAAA